MLMQRLLLYGCARQSNVSFTRGNSAHGIFYRISGNNVITIETQRHVRHSDKCLSSPTVLRSLLTACKKTTTKTPWTFCGRSDFCRDKLIGQNPKWTSYSPNALASATMCLCVTALPPFTLSCIKLKDTYCTPGETNCATVQPTSSDEAPK
jgi:hypothetical protein